MMRSAALGTAYVPKISGVGLLRAITCLGAIALLIERLWIMSDMPLWLDETWTAMIVTQPDWASFWREAWLDCNPPLYYIVLKIWVAIAGDSNFALRLPSLVLTMSAAFAALKLSPRSLGDLGKWTWSALILFWVFAATVSMDARGYGLLLLLSTLGCVLFARLYRDLSLRTAVLWVATCSLMFLTHYYAAPLIAAQGLLLAYRHRMRILTVWPAGLVGLPALAWLWFHVPRLRDYARPDVAWYDPLRLESTVSFGRFILGDVGPTLAPLALIFVLAGLALNIGKRDREAEEEKDGYRPAIDPALWATAASAILGFLIALLVGAIQASLTERYLVPLVPPAMLGLVLVALQSRKRELVCCLLVSLSLAPSLNFPELKEAATTRNSYGYEKGSDFLAPYRPTQVIFAWDHPAAKILDRTSLEKIGGYFLKRAGGSFETTALILPEQDDPNVELVRAANGERPAIIWLFNTQRKSAARHHPPAIGQDPAWSCREFIRSNKVNALGAVACIRNGGGNA